MQFFLHFTSQTFEFSQAHAVTRKHLKLQKSRVLPLQHFHCNCQLENRNWCTYIKDHHQKKTSCVCLLYQQPATLGLLIRFLTPKKISGYWSGDLSTKLNPGWNPRGDNGSKQRCRTNYYTLGVHCAPSLFWTVLTGKLGLSLHSEKFIDLMFNQLSMFEKVVLQKNFLL